ncbi:MAG: alpha/beta hydrolase [Actinobacteria bacterium]|nr:alpha/beta hydrolase [Actinomycetota bacterium]
MSDAFVVSRDNCLLAGERWPGGSPVIVLLHEGVADRRSWRDVATRLAPALTVIAYDRRGFGETPPATGPFSHAEDLLAVLDEVAGGPVWLVGASAGGGLALDTALLAPERVSGLVLFGTAVSGAPEPELDAATQRFDKLIDQAIAAGDLAEQNRLETWLWLDGPAQPEGRVTGEARSLALDMNAIVLRNGVPESAGASDVAAWNRLAEVRVPVTVACGDLDVPFVLARSRELADRLPDARFQQLPGMAHQPYLEQPEFVANLVMGAVTPA